MKSVSCWRDLESYGIEALTGEAGCLMLRLLCDITAKGQKIIEKALGCRIIPAEAWNRGTEAEPHIGSIMRTQEMLIPLGIFALLESGGSVVCLLDDRSLMGFEPDDKQEAWTGIHTIHRTFSYGGTAGDRNRHELSGRTE